MSRRDLSEKERAVAARQSGLATWSASKGGSAPRYAVKALSDDDIEFELQRSGSDPGWLAAVQVEAELREATRGEG